MVPDGDAGRDAHAKAQISSVACPWLEQGLAGRRIKVGDGPVRHPARAEERRRPRGADDGRRADIPLEIRQIRAGRTGGQRRRADRAEADEPNRGAAATIEIVVRAQEAEGAGDIARAAGRKVTRLPASVLLSAMNAASP